tara:strand:+ start:2503 stop:3423 length:921 start_codon:yes stop_codon:yes gene_type:complete
MFYRFFVENLGLKLLATALATGFWLSVAGEGVIERGFEVPVGFENVPADLQVAGDPPDTVHVRVRGPMSIVNRLALGDVVAVLDLTGERPGERRLFDMFADRVRVPFGVEVIQVIPSTITAALERAGEPRTVPVVPDIEGRPAEGFTVGRISTVPESVEIIGPNSLLNNVAEAITEPVSIEGSSERVQSLVTIGVSHRVLRLQTPSSAEVTVEIVPAPVERNLQGVTVSSRSVEPGLRVSIEPVDVTVGVRGSEALLENVEDGGVEVFVDLAGLSTGRYNLPVTVASSADVGITHIDPPNVVVVLQ